MPVSNRLTIGLTGGVASGKSAAAECFRNLGIDIADADRFARDAVAPGQPALARIGRALGEDIVDPDGQLDRRRLRRRVFADSEARRTLERIIHPFVREALVRARDAATSAYVILAVPLLVESNLDVLADRVLVIDVPVATQIERLIQRDGVDRALARQMIAAQCTREQRLARADDVIVNTGSLQALCERVNELHRCYLGLAST